MIELKLQELYDAKISSDKIEKEIEKEIKVLLAEKYNDLVGRSILYEGDYVLIEDIDFDIDFNTKGDDFSELFMDYSLRLHCLCFNTDILLVNDSQVISVQRNDIQSVLYDNLIEDSEFDKQVDIILNKVRNNISRVRGCDMNM